MTLTWLKTHWLRAALVLVLLTSGPWLVVAGGPTQDQHAGPINRVDDRPLKQRVGQQIAQPIPGNGGPVVISTQGNDFKGYSAEVFAFAPNGTLLWVNSTYGVYYDVDPSPAGARTITYLGSTDWTGDQCPMVAADKCTDNRLVRVNISTGESTLLYHGVTAGHQHSRWHDADRINDSFWVVAGIEHDRVFVVNTTSDEIVWQWNASSYYPPPSQSGGPPDDWTHLNDVEVLPDGSIMVSLRNLDQVIRLRRNGTVDESWTIGGDDQLSTLYEQHNPDYIPPSRGGPAVLIADSQNDRIIEYERANGSWTPTWVWRDKQMRWPRDADRLPNGDTLITDSHADRVILVDPSGDVSWRLGVGIPYEAERLGTGDESAGGPAAASSRFKSLRHDTPWALRSVIGPKRYDGVSWVLPAWLTLEEALVGFVFLVAACWLTAIEISARTQAKDAADADETPT